MWRVVILFALLLNMFKILKIQRLSKLVSRIKEGFRNPPQKSLDGGNRQEPRYLNKFDCGSNIPFQ